MRDEYDVEKLPGTYRGLLDPAQPVPPGVTFIATGPNWLGVIGGLAGGVRALLCGLLSVVAYIVDANSGPVTIYSGGAGCFLTAAALGLAIGVGLLLIARVQHRRLTAGTNGTGQRYGLFLAPDGLLLRGGIGYTLLPRERIIGARLEGSHAQVRYRRDNGTPFQVTLDQHYDNVAGPQLLAMVRQWLGADPR